MFQGQVWLMGFHEFESFHEMFVSPLFLLRLSNSASYQKLASNSPAKELPKPLGDCLRPKTHLRKFAFPCRADGKVRGSKSLPRTGTRILLRNSRIFSKSSSLFGKFRLDLWWRRAWSSRRNERAWTWGSFRSVSTCEWKFYFLIAKCDISDLRHDFGAHSDLLKVADVGEDRKFFFLCDAICYKVIVSDVSTVFEMVEVEALLIHQKISDMQH